MTEISLIKIDGKPLAKLIEVVAAGCGVLYEPKRIRKKADAEAYALKVIEEAKLQISSDEDVTNTLVNVQKRILHREINKQQNIEDVTKIAAEHLSNAEVSEEPVDKDWATRFFNIAEDISSEEAKKLWGKILAGEIKKPKSYSLRALDILKNMSREEAEIFVKIGKYTLKTPGGDKDDCFVVKDDNFFNGKGLRFKDLLLLEEIGLLQSTFGLAYNFKSSKPIPAVLIYGDHCIILAMQIGSELKLPIVKVTRVGQELLNLIEPEFNEEYVKLLVNKLKCKVEASYAKIHSLDNGMISYGGLTRINR